MAAELTIGKEWKPLVELPSQVFGYRMVAVGNDRIALVGGIFQSVTPSDSIDIYNLEKKEWSSYEMKFQRQGCAVVAVGEQIYIFGGRLTADFFSDYLSCAEILDLSVEFPETQFLPQMSEARFAFSAVLYNKTNIVVLGGKNDRLLLSTVEMFDTIKHEWTKLPSMLTGKMFFAAGAAGSRIIVAGGHNLDSGDLNTVEILDMRTQKWKETTRMNQKRGEVCGAVVDCYKNSFHMIAVSGNKSCEAYSFDNEKWSTIPGFTSICEANDVVVLNGMLIAGDHKRLETLSIFVKPDCLYKLVHLAAEFDLLTNKSWRELLPAKRERKCSAVDLLGSSHHRS